MNILKKILLLILALFCLSLQAEDRISIASPNGKVKATFYLSNDRGMMWKVQCGDRPVVLPSSLGIGIYQNNLEIKDVTTVTVDTVWKPVYGERSIIKDNYNGKSIRIAKSNNKHNLILEIRAYDAGVAFRYFFEEHPDGGTYLSIRNEKTAFSFPEGTMAWFTPLAQTEYKLLPLSNWPGESERPLTLQLKNGIYACLSEAEMINYARTKFALDKVKPNTIVSSLYDVVDDITPFASPWRVVMMSETPAELLENNDLFLNLNKPCEIEDVSWIRPGKVMREVTLSTEGAKKLVDFAVKRNLQYIHFDAGWYGYEYLVTSDARNVNVDPRRNRKNNLDLKEAIAYAKSKNIGVILYVNQRALANQLDELLPLYKSWGVAGIKFGFVHVGSHRWTVWLHEAVRKCAKYQLMVDIHDEYRPTGFSRTYPNLMTQEGIRGNEEMPDATHNTVLPFTRFIAGAADYTICYYKQKFGDESAVNPVTGRRRLIQTTSAHQLALSVIYYSPLQYMYWYDRPEDSRDEPELAFFDAVPTVWDNTRVLDGAPGKMAVLARRSGNDWFVGCITNNDARTINVPLSFLDNGNYKMLLYTDGSDNIKTRTKVKVEERIVNNKSDLNLPLKVSGGAAIHLIKE